MLLAVALNIGGDDDDDALDDVLFALEDDGLVVDVASGENVVIGEKIVDDLAVVGGRVDMDFRVAVAFALEEP